MLKHHIKKILSDKPDHAGLSAVIEKEILHHDLMHILLEQGVLHNFTFIGGTCLRLCYNSSRLSEDLDFNAGYDFKPTQLTGLDKEIKHYLSRKYDAEVYVSEPSDKTTGDTVSWNISIERVPGRPDLPRQKIHLDVCAIPSFDVVKRPLINHYGINLATEGYLIPVQSLNEMLVDKLIALAYRARRIKPRDLWDIVWLTQQNAKLDKTLLSQKLKARKKSEQEFETMLQNQAHKLANDKLVYEDFISEMSRFIPATIKQRTIDNPQYWAYLQNEVSPLIQKTLNDYNSPKNPFNMS